MAFLFSYTDYSSYKWLNLELNIYWNNPEKHYRSTFSKRVWIPTEAFRGCSLIRYLILIGSIAANYAYDAGSNFVVFRSCFWVKDSPFLGCYCRKLSTTNHQSSLWLYTKHLMDMFPCFWIRWSSTFGKYSIFHSL